jgi:hypothetical protein
MRLVRNLAVAGIMSLLSACATAPQMNGPQVAAPSDINPATPDTTTVMPSELIGSWIGSWNNGLVSDAFRMEVTSVEVTKIAGEMRISGTEGYHNERWVSFEGKITLDQEGHATKLEGQHAYGGKFWLDVVSRTKMTGKGSGARWVTLEFTKITN